MDTLLKTNEALRRRMHNTIQELKGNIRVYCRVRPPTGGKDCDTVQFEGDDKSIQVHGRSSKSATGQNAVTKHHFQFDKVVPLYFFALVVLVCQMQLPTH